MINYTESFNFKPIPAITPLDGYWQNGTWKFNMSEITAGTTSQPSWIDIILHGNTALTLVNAKANGLNYLKLFGGTELLSGTYLDSVTLSGGTEQRNLPSGFTQVEYIQSDGTQYIDTGIIIGSSFYEIFVDFQVTSLVDFESVYGARTSSQAARLDNWFGISVGGYGLNNTSTQALNDFTTNRTQIINTRTSVTKNGVPDVVSSYNNSADIQYSMYLFATNNANTAVNFLRGKIYKATIKKDNILSFNGIPCRRNSDSVLGMYDTVTGNFFTNAGTGTFTAGADVVPTPTPTTPMDIVCNNGVLKARHQSGLPLGYTLLDYIESTGTQYINTGVACTYYSYDFDIIISKPSGVYDSIIFVHDRAQNKRFNVAQASVQEETINLGLGDSPTTSTTINYSSFSEPLHIIKHIGKNTAYGTVNNVAYNCSYTADSYKINNSSIILLAKNEITTGSNTISEQYSGRLYSCIIKTNSILARNLIPARRNSDSVLGMFDTVTGQFFTNAGTGSFTAGNPVSDSVEIYTDGTVETVNVHGKNLFDGQLEYGSIAVPDLLDRVRPTHAITLPGGTYTVSCAADYEMYVTLNDVLVRNWSSEVPINATSQSDTIMFTLRNKSNPSATLDLDSAFNIQLEQGSTATTYEPYFNGGTATAEMLFKVGDYKDTQEVLAGDVTRNVGVMVLDGTENWQVYAPGHYYLLGIFSGLSSIAGSLCTHFTVTNSNSHRYDMNIDYGGTQPANLFVRYEAMTTLSDFKQFLADQYNAGTPVIIVYPLATSTTETVTGQELTTQAGTNIVEITQASIDNLELEVSYKAGVEVTITEVQNAQLDNSVEVTIA